MPNEYPPEWISGEVQQLIYANANWHCEHCGMAFYPKTTLAITARRRDGNPFILTVHHINGDKSDCTYSNLVALCQACHLHVQAQWKPGQPLPWDNVPQWILARALPYQSNPQPRLFAFENMVR